MFAAMIRYAFTLTRPVLFIGAVFIGLALVSEPRPTAGAATSCTGFTSNIELNRMLCLLSPAHLFNGERKSLF